MAKVKTRATLLTGPHKHEQAKTIPGAFWYAVRDVAFDGEGKQKHVGIIHSCPCGCGSLGYLNLDQTRKRPLWTLTGPADAPTLAPSIVIDAQSDDPTINRDGTHWHGWLKNGVWQSC